MARLKLDLRPVLRLIASRIQDENQDRLLSEQGVRDEELEPRKERASAQDPGRKRVRILGVRIKLKSLSEKLGVQTGALLKDLVRRGNIKLGRLGFKIVPSADVRIRWIVFNKGREGKQPPRPVGGATAQTLESAAEEVARAAREQLVQALNDREKTP